MMNTSATICRTLQTLPPEGVHREVGLLRLTDLYAAEASVRALRAAAERARGSQDPADQASVATAEVLAVAAELWDGSGVGIPSPEDGAARDRLSRAVSSPAFSLVIRCWIDELRQVADRRPGSGACAVATALQLWRWTMTHFLRTSITGDAPIVEIAEAFCWLAAARAQILETMAEPGAERMFADDLCHVQAARSAGAVSTLCADLVFGYRRHPSWDADGCAGCYTAGDLDELEGLIPGLTSGARAHSDVIEADGSHPPKAGPCAKRDGVEGFVQLRTKLDGCLTGSRLAKRRAAEALPRIAAAMQSASTR